MALVCETVTASSMAELRAARDRAVAADLVELRLDGVSDLDVAGALADRAKPVIVTCRPEWEGGAFKGSESDRLRILGEAISLGAEFVDIEWRANRAALRRGDRTRLIVSLHDFAGLPGDLSHTVRSMRAAAGNGVIKVAVATTTPADCVRLRELAGRGSEQVIIGMGAAGLVTRVCPWLFDSAWTYGGTAAPGQTSVTDLVRSYRVRQTGDSTAIYSIIGSPLSHSASPALHNAAFAATGINAVYVAMDTRDADGFLKAADALGVKGASITAPLKSGWLERGVEVDDIGRAVGAINTLKRTESGWVGRNFDIDGFLAPLSRRNIPMRGKRAIVLGAGGAARAVAWALQREGMTVGVSARRGPAAATLAADLGADVAPWPPPGGADIVVNATPVGTWPDADKAPVPSCDAKLVYDLIYNPAETRLLRQARASGAQTIGGLEMLIAQAEQQFSFWTGTTAPPDVMERAAVEFLRQRNT